jgi:hypothetical protein
MKMHGMMPSLLVLAGLAFLPVRAKAQSPGDGAAVLPSSATPHEQPDLVYIPPTEKTKLRNYFFDAFGPYPIIGAALAAGVNQAYNTPPEWEQGSEAYGKRLGSNFAIAAVSTTTRYTLAEAFRQDTLYYRCECKGFLPRLRHAMISTFTARHASDGNRVFSFPALAAPYAGTMTAVYAWYPGRYNAKDGFRMGNYTLLGYASQNVAFEFLYGGPHKLLSRMHLSNGRGAPVPSSRP